MTSKAIIALIVVAYLGLGGLYASQTPPWQSPDEPAHYNHVRYIADHGRLPELTAGCYDEAYLNDIKSRKFPPELSTDSICYEHYQPPLYYLLAAPIYALSNGSLLVLRLFSVILGAASLGLVYQTIGLIFPNPVFALGTAAFVAFVPMHLSMLASVNNDSLAELLFIWLHLLLLGWLLKAPRERALPTLIGVVLGLILITKVTVYTALPLVLLVIFLKDHRAAALLSNGARAFLPALVIALPLYIRNSMVYGGFDILGLDRHDAVVVGQLRTADYLAEIGLGPYLGNLSRTIFHSFWGQFGWMAVPMDGRVYLALNLLQLLVLAGLIWWVWQSAPQDRTTRLGLMVMVATIILTAGIFIGLNLSFVQFQGRYLFPALMPIGLFFTLGLYEAFRRPRALVMAALALLLTVWVALSSLLSTTGLDKWGVLIGGAALVGLVVRRWIPLADGKWFLAGVYVALAGLAALSVPWFIVPNL